MNDLPTLDAELYRNLMHLRDYQGEAADLALTFTVADSALGVHREVRPLSLRGLRPHRPAAGLQLPAQAVCIPYYQTSAVSLRSAESSPRACTECDMPRSHSSERSSSLGHLCPHDFKRHAAGRNRLRRCS